MKKLFLLLVAVLTIGLAASAQTRTVTGTVTDESNGEPIVGASVLPFGEKMGVSTDVDGNFSIVVPTSVQRLTFSYVGMHEKTLHIPANGKMSVQLEPNSTMLDETIVVAYGTAKKAAYTGSASVVKADQLEDAMVANVTNALSGKMAGVQTLSSDGAPGQGSSVRIRGVGSINLSSTPLYVVDGMPFDGDINTIATNDIESMTVLKDAASTALYGARGANGVILITTKKGKAGEAKITVDMRWGSNSRAIPQYDVISDTRQYYETYFQAAMNDATKYKKLTGDAAFLYANNSINNFGYTTYTIPGGEYAFDANGKFNPNATPGYSNGRYYFLADDWTKETLIHGLRQEYTVGIQGGNDRLNYYVSGSYLEDGGIIKNSHFKRLSTRTSVDYQAKSWLKIGTTMNYTYTDSAYPDDNTNENATSSGNAFYFINGLAPVYPFYVRNPDGSIMINSTYGNKVYDYGDGKNYGNGPLGFTRTPSGNPVGQLTYDTTDYLVDMFDGKWYAQITPIENLNVTGTVGYMVDNTRLHQVLNGVYGQFAEMGGQAIQVAQRTRSLQTQLLASYGFTLAEKHNIDVLAGYEYQSLQLETAQAIGSNLYNPNSFVVNNTIDQRNGYGDQANLVHIGWLGRLNYNYDNRYFFMASIRHDGSSRFAPEHRWGTFWSASAGWNISSEKFMEDATWLDLLKFKISFGQNGNDAVGSNYIAYTDFYQMTGADGVFSDATLSYKGNRDITWEKSSAFNTGFDFAMWNGKLQGTIEYYSRTTSNMLLNLPTAPSLGYSSIPMNVGKMRNYGFELELNYTIFNNRNITWDVFANVTAPSNKVLKLDPSILNEDGEWISGSRIFQIGKSMYQSYLVEYCGVGQEDTEAYVKNPVKDALGNVIGYSYDPYNVAGLALYRASKPHYNEDGVENGKEEYLTPDYNEAYNTNRKATGNLMPKVYGGFGTSVKAYGFDLSLSFAYQAGGRITDTSYRGFMHSGSETGHAWHKDVMNAWTPTNTNTDVPALYASGGAYKYANAAGTRWLTSSNYVSLNNITFGYTLPSKLTKKFSLQSVRFYGVAENVALWSRRKGLDPRQGFVSSENSTYSPMRTISGGVRVDF
ncbi:MAG: TonB-dependent receptor [Clostridium sp.]|nr:TonB-dependent receptor [Clostridium sp.]